MLRYRTGLLRLLVLVACASCRAIPQPCGKKDVLCWQLQLAPDQCSSPAESPCYNIYAINQSTGVLNWYAYTTSSTGIKAMSVGRRSVYYTTWEGPGLYTINAGTGHVRWQFPVDNWFRYWKKDIDLPPSASFSSADEVKDLVYVAAAGPPSRLYGLRTKSGSKQWEFKSPVPAAVLADAAGPASSSRRHPRTIFLAYNVPASQSSNSSAWLQALDVDTGRSIWKSESLQELQVDGVEVYRTLLATSAAGNAILAYNVSDGRQLWRHAAQFCSTPSPITETHNDQLVLLRNCSGPLHLSVIGAETGTLYWDGWQVPRDAEPTGNCTHITVQDGSIIFGCSCNITTTHRHNTSSADIGEQPQQIGPHFGSSNDSKQHEPRRRREETAPGVCMYAVSMHSGKWQWVLPRVGGASFPPDAQTWGVRPLLHQGLAIFLTDSQLYAVNAVYGNLSWALQLPPGDVLQPWQLPVLDAASNILLLTPQHNSNKTAVTAVSTLNGKVLWRRTVNGTAQPPQGVVAGAEQLWISDMLVYVESCRNRTCCLRAFYMSNGKQKWGVCLDAEQGEDATHPHAQFAIWLITLVTIGSIALLIVGACLLYVHRWREERKILDDEDDNVSSPRHIYRPLPDRVDGSDSENEGAERYKAVARPLGGPVLPASSPPVRRLPFAQRPALPAAQQQLFHEAPRVGNTNGRFQEEQGLATAGVARLADSHAIGQHLEAVWVQERGAISGMNRARVPADDEPHQPDSD